MVALHQFLELGLDRRLAGCLFKAERLERFAGRVVDGFSMLCIGLFGTVAEHSERMLAPRIARAGTGHGTACAGGALTHFPGRAMAGQRVLLVLRDLIDAHVLEEVV